MQVTSTFWVVTQPLPKAERATIPNLKEEKQGFHMSPIAEIFIGEIALKSSDWLFKSRPPHRTCALTLDSPTVTETSQKQPKTRAGTIHDSKNRESIQNPNFGVILIHWINDSSKISESCRPYPKPRKLPGRVVKKIEFFEDRSSDLLQGKDRSRSRSWSSNHIVNIAR